MKTKSFWLCFGGTALGIAMLQAAEPASPPTPPPGQVLVSAVPPAPASVGPKIQFATPVYDFVKTKAGDPIKHVFYFTNVGDATLELSNVRPGCGCTTTGEWTKKVEPGNTGSIPIQVATVNFNGPVVKTVNVDSNDKTQPSTVLQIKGTIWRPIEVNPQLAYMNIVADAPENASSTVKIINNTEEPMTVSPPESNNKQFKAEIKTVQPGKEFELVVKPVPPLTPGSIQGQITVKTTSTNMPLITVSTFANVQAAVTVTPTQITLPGGPLGTITKPTITIQNNGTNSVQLSDATVNAKGVDLSLAEPQPGKLFTATLSFPQGFEMGQGEKVEFEVKTTHPQFPVIKVPVVQLPKPALPPVAPVTPVGAPAKPSASLGPITPPPVPAPARASK
ncbi:MAG TPA: DUF1573 domain-containing protein [Candidatus Dormibacteraeota bacterium]|nr:DUF1573 domain-containing protein [Candidatus Dormibacteraeota bacterium]